MKRLLALFFGFALVAAACGSDDEAEVSASDDAAEDSGSDSSDEDVDAADDESTDDADDAEADDAGTDDAGTDDAGSADGLEELNVAYFLNWPTANLLPLSEKTYDDTIGVPINWVPFASGGDMAVAMEAGDIDIAYSQGLTPFANFVTGGSDLLMVGVAVSYSEADNCAANPELGMTAENAKDILPGKSIYTPLGNVTHFKLLKMLEHLEVDTSQVTFIQSEGPAAGVAALTAGEVALSCTFGGAVNEMIAAGGNLLMTGAEQEAIGIRVFDITSTTGAFAEAHPEVVTAFLQITEQANADYLADPDATIDVLASTAGMELDAAKVLAGQMAYPTIEEQLSEAWLGGTVADVMKEQMEFFVEQGEIDSNLSDYSEFIDTSFLEAVTLN